MHGFTLHQLILEHNPKYSSVKCCSWKYVLRIQRWAAFPTDFNSLGRMGTLLPRNCFPVCISLSAIIVAQALSIHAIVKHDTAGRTGQGTGDAYYPCEGYQNAAGCYCLQLICQQLSILTLVDTSATLFYLLWLFSTFNLFCVGLQG